MRFLLTLAALTCAAVSLLAQPYATKPLPTDKFRQLEELLPTPNEQRTASGAPGRGYWQQRADYTIDAELNDAHQSIAGRETIVYSNNSPDSLTYLWLQLDANLHAKNSDANIASSLGGRGGADPLDKFPYRSLESILARETYDSALKIGEVSDASGQPLAHTIVKTMMRVDLPQPLAPGAKTTFHVAWSYLVNDAKIVGGRSGYEYFEKDQNYIYEIAQWFPRMAVYNDTMGWQHKQFIGRGEFTLEFGDYLVRLTVPDDHIVAGTGVLQNPEQVLTAAQSDRLKQAETAKAPVFVVTPEEAKKNESNKPAGKKT